MFIPRYTVNDCEKKAAEARKAAALATSATARWEHLQIGRVWDEIACDMRRNGLASVVAGHNPSVMA